MASLILDREVERGVPRVGPAHIPNRAVVLSMGLWGGRCAKKLIDEGIQTQQRPPFDADSLESDEPEKTLFVFFSRGGNPDRGFLFLREVLIQGSRGVIYRTWTPKSDEVALSEVTGHFVANHWEDQTFDRLIAWVNDPEVEARRSTFLRFSPPARAEIIHRRRYPMSIL